MPSNYAYNLPDAADQWVSRTATPEEVAFEKLPLTGQLNAVKLAMESDEVKAATVQFLKDVETFKAMYPSYSDTPANMRVMKQFWNEVLRVEIPSLEQIEQSYFACREHNTIALNQAAVAREKKAEIEERAAKIKATREAKAFDEDSAYSLSMEDLEARCRGWK